MKYIICLLLLQVFTSTFGQTVEKEYRIEAYQKDGDTTTLILKIKGVEQPQIVPKVAPKLQLDEDEDEVVPSSTPFIPQIIPGLTKIFNGIVTGNLNEIFHGSTSFAPNANQYAIDTVYNTVVGIPPPKTTIRTTTVAPVANSTVAATAAPDDDDEEENDTAGFLPNRRVGAKRVPRRVSRE